MTKELIQDHFFAPRNVGEVSGAAFNGRAGSLTCGAAIRISIKVDQSQTISEIRFKAAGCSVLVASASMLTEAVKGKTTADAAALAQQSDEIASELNLDSLEMLRCRALASEALLSAIASYSDSVRNDWEGDEALICTCFCVSERRIEAEIQRGQLCTVLEVMKACRAGAGCRSCWPLIEEMLACELSEK
jgi:NifU-like protein